MSGIRPGLARPCGYCDGPGPQPIYADSFALLYASMEACGWRPDAVGTWTCPDCQRRPDWRPPRPPKLASEQPPPRRRGPLITTGALPRVRRRRLHGVDR